MPRSAAAHAFRRSVMENRKKAPSDEANGSAPGGAKYRRLKPRIGSQYQAKVAASRPAGGWSPARPLPRPLFASTEEDYEAFSKQQALLVTSANEESEHKVQTASQDAAATTDGPTEAQDKSQQYQEKAAVLDRSETLSSRCIHKPSHETDSWLSYCRPLHLAVSGCKRKAGCEQDAQALAYRNERPNAQAAELGLLVQLSAGRACQTRKRAKLGSTHFRPTMMGDYRRKPHIHWYPQADSSQPGNISNGTADQESSGMARKTKVKMARHRLENAQALDTKIKQKQAVTVVEVCQALSERHRSTDEQDPCWDSLHQSLAQARAVQAHWLDACHAHGYDSTLLKLIDLSPLVLPETPELRRAVQAAEDWKREVDGLVSQDLSPSPDDWERLEGLLRRRAEAPLKPWQQLDERMQKARQLRARIEEYQAEKPRESVKFVAGLVREFHRLRIGFPAGCALVDFYAAVEAWAERAQIAIRSRISLDEIEDLVRRGEELPLDLEEYLDKLRSRVSSAQAWIQSLQEELVSDTEESDPSPANNASAMLKRIRRAINGDTSKQGIFLELASEGNRIPVEVECVKFLQIELDAKNWSMKAQKWLENRRGKMEDLREHLQKAETLRSRIGGSVPGWTLDGEDKLCSIVDAADAWFEKYKPYLIGDNRRHNGRSCLSINLLRQIVHEGKSIHANIGSALAKIAKILAQAETWLGKYQTLLDLCHARSPRTLFVTVEQLEEAVQAAASDVSLDLDEAMELGRLSKRIEQWLERASTVAPKRSKRKTRKPSVAELIELVEEAEQLPVNTGVQVARLNEQLSSIQTWRSKAHQDIASIANGFEQMREFINATYGVPGAFGAPGSFPPGASSSGQIDEPGIDGMKVADDPSVEDSPATEDPARAVGGRVNVHVLIKTFQKEAGLTFVRTAEAEVAELLTGVSAWCVKSSRYLATPREVFDKRYFGAFDRFITEGQELVSLADKENGGTTLGLEDQMLSKRLSLSWQNLVRDQLQRLGMLVQERERFMAWCSKAKGFLRGKDITIEKLRELAEESRNFPATTDTVHKVRTLTSKATEWIDYINNIMNSQRRITMLEAKTLLETGEKIGVGSKELKALRNAIRTVRSWANRVKKSKLDKSDIASIKALIKEHDSFLIEMPEERSMLKQAMKNYCICRRPYDGFMIGCDECDEWYHGACVGLTESRADRFDKYICVRCCISRVFKTSVTSAVTVVKKWTSAKELKAARQTDSRKQQRKVRKETKDIEKLRAEVWGFEKVLGDLSTISGGGVGNLIAASNCAERQQIKARFEKATEAVKLCEIRLASLSTQGIERKKMEDSEDRDATKLRMWCVRARSLVLAPASQDHVESSRPTDGAVSRPMRSLIEEADAMRIRHHRDVALVINSFRCMSWSMRALSIVSRQPSISEMERLVENASSIKLPEDRALKMMRSMLQRSAAWQAKVSKALMPTESETRPLDLVLLKNLADSAASVPLRVPEAQWLFAAIEDMGARHCVCGRPSSGGFMLSCDKCERWFHGVCVRMSKETLGTMKTWICPSCAGVAIDPAEVRATLNWEDSSHCFEEDISSFAPDVVKMWPPLGISGSKEAIEALGPECIALPDDVSDFFKKPAPEGFAQGSSPSTGIVAAYAKRLPTPAVVSPELRMDTGVASQSPLQFVARSTVTTSKKECARNDYAIPHEPRRISVQASPVGVRKRGTAHIAAEKKMAGKDGAQFVGHHWESGLAMNATLSVGAATEMCCSPHPENREGGRSICRSQSNAISGPALPPSTGARHMLGPTRPYVAPSYTTFASASGGAPGEPHNPERMVPSDLSQVVQDVMVAPINEHVAT